MKSKLKLISALLIGGAAVATFTTLGVKLHQTSEVQGRDYIVVTLKNSAFLGPIVVPVATSVSEICQKIGVDDETSVYRVNGKTKTAITKTTKLNQNTTLSFQLK